jgi:hypothetical protein
MHKLAEPSFVSPKGVGDRDPQPVCHGRYAFLTLFSDPCCRAIQILFRKMMAMSENVHYDASVDLDTLAPTAAGLSSHFQVNWGRILDSQRGSVYMRPLFTLIPGGDAHFNCVIALKGEIILLDTWGKDPNISPHTALSMAFHTVKDGFGSTLQGVRVQLHDQKKSKQCWSLLFLYMARLARHLEKESNAQDVLNILSTTKAPKSITSRSLQFFL